MKRTRSDDRARWQHGHLRRWAPVPTAAQRPRVFVVGSEGTPSTGARAQGPSLQIRLRDPPQWPEARGRRSVSGSAWTLGSAQVLDTAFR
jgi:hypothetical protein